MKLKENTKHQSSSPRYLLDSKVQEMMTDLEIRESYDIPKILPAFLLTLSTLSIVLSVVFYNPNFLSSQTGYINGGNANQHYLEVIQLKEFLQNGTTDFWFSDNSLGYPMFLTRQPLSSFVTALVIILFERFASPLCIFRWLIVVIVAIIPISWYKGIKKINLSRTESLIIGILMLLLDSQHQNGFELNAYLKEGLVPQLYSQVLFPLTVASLYCHGMSDHKQEKSTAVYFLCLTYLCNAFIGFYCSILSFITHFLCAVTKSSLKEFKGFFTLHAKLCLYMSWVIIPCLISYPYIGGATFKRYGGFTLPHIADLFTSGVMFDYRRYVPWITISISFGLLICIKHLYDFVKTSTQKVNRKRQQQLYSWWLVLISSVTCFLYMKNVIVDSIMNIMPFDFDFDNKFFLIGLHTCGIFFAAKSIHCIINLVYYIDFVSLSFQKGLKTLFVFAISLVLIKHGVVRVGQRVSMLEVSEEFVQTLDKMKNDHRSEGRILAHSELGSGRSWDMSNIPILTGKPGAMTYSNGWDDSLSAYYIDSIPFGYVSVAQLKSVLKLYNIQYLAVSAAFIDQHFEYASLKHLYSVDDLVFYEVFSDDEEPVSSYFEFVHLPGHIDGNLKNIRDAVLATLTLYGANSLLYLNPRKSNSVRDKGVLNIQVSVPNKSLKSSDSDVLWVRWRLNNEDINSEEALIQTESLYYNVDIQSRIIEQKNSGLEYHAVVEIANDAETDSFAHLEHLLLKISYHPFWRCAYFPVDQSYSLTDFFQNLKPIPRNRTSLSVDHVTPNLISVSLPAGKYHVMFQYRTPGILKIMAVIAFVIFVNNALCLMLFTRICHVIIVLWNRIEVFQMHLLFGLINLLNKRYYNSVDVDVESMLRRLSTIEFRIRKRIRVTELITDIYVTCKRSLSSVFGMRKISVTAHGTDDPLPISSVDSLNEKVSETSDTCVAQLPDGVPLDRVHQSMDVILSSDHDTSFSCESLLYKSPPTPPKHTKKSHRKRNARVLNSEEVFNNNKVHVTEEDLFKTSPKKSTSPVLGNILESLRKKSLSPKDRSPSHRIEKFSPSLRGKRTENSSPRRESIVTHPSSTPRRESLVSSSSPRIGSLVQESSLFSPRRETLVPDPSQSSISCNSESFLDSKNNNNIRKQTLVPSYNNNPVSPQSRTNKKGTDPNNSFNSGGECEWDDMLFELSYNTNEGEEDQELYGPREIDINRIVSVDPIKKEHGEFDCSELSLEDSFSPRSSSSPELSIPSPDRFSNSPDGHSSPDNSLEFKGFNEDADKVENAETELNSDLYRICLADSPRTDEQNSARRHTIHVDSMLNSEASGFQSPGRRATISTATESRIEEESIQPKSPHQLRRKRIHNVSFEESTK